MNHSLSVVLNGACVMLQILLLSLNNVYKLHKIIRCLVPLFSFELLSKVIVYWNRNARKGRVINSPW